MADEDDNFLSRWSRRKVAVNAGKPLLAELPPVPVVTVPVQDQREQPLARPLTDEAPTAAEAPPPALTLDDVAQLTKDSDYSRFVAPDVDASVKNAAMKKLFASDPHFNVMDRLDIYIDDYNKFEPIPKSMLRQLVSARALGLIDDELEEQPKPDNPPTHEDAAVQLQPDDATGQRIADEGARPDDAGGDPDDAVPPRSA